MEKYAHLSQIEIAKRIGVSTRTIRYWKKGTYKPKHTRIRKIGNVFKKVIRDKELHLLMINAISKKVVGCVRTFPNKKRAEIEKDKDEYVNADMIMCLWYVIVTLKELKQNLQKYISTFYEYGCENAHNVEEELYLIVRGKK